MKKALLTVFAAGLALLPASAKPLDLSKVSRNANWLMHMDFDAMRNSDVGVFMRESMEKIPDPGKGLAYAPEPLLSGRSRPWPLRRSAIVLAFRERFRIRKPVACLPGR